MFVVVFFAGTCMCFVCILSTYIVILMWSNRIQSFIHAIYFTRTRSGSSSGSNIFESTNTAEELQQMFSHIEKKNRWFFSILRQSYASVVLVLAPKYKCGRILSLFPDWCLMPKEPKAMIDWCIKGWVYTRDAIIFVQCVSLSRSFHVVRCVCVRLQFP